MKLLLPKELFQKERQRFLLLLYFLGSLSFSSPALPKVEDSLQPSEGREIHISASQQKLIGKSTWSAEGNVQINVDGKYLRADRVLIFLGKPGQERLVKAMGSVLFRQVLPSRTRRPITEVPLQVKAQQATYDLDQEEGELLQAEASYQGLQLRAQKMKIIPPLEKPSSSNTPRILLESAWFSACNRPHPEYHLEAKELDLKPGDKATARSTSLYLGNFRLFRIPYHQIDLRKGTPTSTLRLPRIERTRLGGWILALPYSLHLGEGIETHLELQTTTRQGLRFHSSVNGLGNPTPFARVTWKEENIGRRRFRVSVARLPEVGLQWRSSHRLPLEGETTLGWFKEFAPQVTAGRLHLDLRIPPQSLFHSGLWSFKGQPGLRISLYSLGKTYWDPNIGLQLHRAFRGDQFLALSFLRHFLQGKTPFLFDEVPVPKELKIDFLVRLGRMVLEGKTRYDLDQSALFDQRFALGYSFHCIEPRLVWRRRLRSLSLEVRLLGFGVGTSEEAQPP